MLDNKICLISKKIFAILKKEEKERRCGIIGLAAGEASQDLLFYFYGNNTIQKHKNFIGIA